MHVNWLNLQAYRRFSEFSISFHPDLTVIAARNGQGKTTVLEALASALGPFVGAFDEARGHHLLRTDAHRRIVGEWPTNEAVYPVVVDASLETDRGTEIEWSRHLNSAKKGAKTTIREAAPLARWGKDLQLAVRDGEDVVLPVVAYYSSKRLSLSQKNHGVRNDNILAGSRTAAYNECLTSGVSSFSQLEVWVQTATLAMLQSRRGNASGQNFARLLDGVAGSVEIALEAEGWTDFKYSFALGELAMVHEDHGELPISMLSDGVRAVISLVADLALRCVRLNPHLGEKAPAATPGVVLIDEVDLHLHPAWQQRIVQSLRSSFPAVQFVLTTHSPQVLSTVKHDEIRVVARDHDGRWSARMPNSEIKGLESSTALSTVMNVDPIPDLVESRMIRKYTQLIENGQAESADAHYLRRQLEHVYGSQHRVIVDADQLIRFQKIKTRISRKKRETGETPS